MAVTDAYKNIFQSGAKLAPNITLDLAARYAAAFGAMAIGRMIDKAFVQQTVDKDYDFTYYPMMSDIPEYVKFEIPELEPLEFSAVLHGDAGSVFAPPLMLNFSADKSLIETETNDNDPVVVERWGTSPWDIQIKGLLIDLTNRIYPTDEIRRLTRNWQYNGVVKVVGQQFEEKDIDSIYFRSVSFSGIEGFQDTIQFTINARSIRGVNYTLLKVNK